MELQFRKSTIPYLNQVLREVQNQEQTQEIRLTDGMPDIGKVLCAWGQVVARSKEWRSDSASFSGGVMVWVLYVPEDGSQPRALESWIPFQMKWDLPRDSRDGSLRVKTLLRFVDARTVSARKIMVRCGVSALAEALVAEEADTYLADEVPENVQLLRNTYPVRLPREAGEKEFLIDEELILPPSCPQPEKLVYYTMHPEVTEQRLMSDKAVFRGNGNLHILFRSEEDTLCAWDFELPFSQLVELEGMYTPEGSVDVQTGITSMELELDEEGHLRLKCALLGQYLIQDQQWLEIVEDAYIPAQDLDITRKTLELPAILESKHENIFAEATIPQETNVIVDCSFLADHPRIRRNGDRMELEIPGQFQVLYYDQNGVLQGSTARWEGQWQMNADEDTRIAAAVQPLATVNAVENGGMIRMDGQLHLAVETVASKGMSMVTELELGEEKMPDPARPSLILRRVERQRLWDIAKSSGSTMDAIRQANDLEDEPVSGQILLIPIS